jgi:hypothetical protein
MVVSFIGAGHPSKFSEKKVTYSMSLTNFIKYSCVKYTSTRMGIKLILMVIGIIQYGLID